ncbi:hypothetical protein WKK05_03645 [Nostoc sp. UHCC 0302]
MAIRLSSKRWNNSASMVNQRPCFGNLLISWICLELAIAWKFA